MKKPTRYDCSHVCHFKPGEEPLERHARRLRIAKENIEQVKAWAEFRGVEMNVTCEDHQHPHAEVWRFRVKLFKAVAFAYWQPGIGRAVRVSRMTGKKSRTGFKLAKIHDHEQLLLFLTEWFESIPKEIPAT